MAICVVGTGYVGLVTGACLAEVGNTVYCIDKDAAKIVGLQAGRLPIYEPGLESLVVRNTQAQRLRFSTRLAEAVEHCDVFYVAVGTPPNEDGSTDLQHVLAVARELGDVLSGYALVINKSTAPVGTAEKVREAIAGELARRGASIDFDVASNPEFLKEGDAVNDFMRPDRIVIGCDTPRAEQRLREIYAPFSTSPEHVIAMGVREAELTKYAANAMLATRISFMNEMALLCELLGVDVESVRRGIGSDRRIGYPFLHPGVGYGGSCFPKDIKSLIHMAQASGIEPMMLHAVHRRNEQQKHRICEKIFARFGKDLGGMRFALWGLAFKPGTDDMREAPSLSIMRDLIGAGARVAAFDPVAMSGASRMVPPEWLADGTLTLVSEQYEAVRGADALVLVTEWKPFAIADWVGLKQLLRQPIIFDGRNLYDRQHVVAEGYEYFGIGR